MKTKPAATLEEEFDLMEDIVLDAQEEEPIEEILDPDSEVENDDIMDKSKIKTENDGLTTSDVLGDWKPGDGVMSAKNVYKDAGIGKGKKNKPEVLRRELKESEVQEYFAEADVQGLEKYTSDRIKSLLMDQIEDRMDEAGLIDSDAKIIGIAIVGSRNRGTAKPDSDLDIVVQYKGRIPEKEFAEILRGTDSMFGPPKIDGIKVDMKPIRKEESGDFEKYLKRSTEYDNYILGMVAEEGKKKRKKRRQGFFRRYYGYYPWFPIHPTPHPPWPKPEPGPNPPPPGPPPPGPPPPGPGPAPAGDMGGGAAPGGAPGGGGAAMEDMEEIHEDENEVNVKAENIRSLKKMSKEQAKDIILKLYGSKISSYIQRFSNDNEGLPKIDLSSTKKLLDPVAIVYFPGNQAVPESFMIAKIIMNPNAESNSFGLDGKKLKRPVFVRMGYDMKSGTLKKYTGDAGMEDQDVFQNKDEIASLFSTTDFKKIKLWVVWGDL